VSQLAVNSHPFVLSPSKDESGAANPFTLRRAQGERILLIKGFA